MEETQAKTETLRVVTEKLHFKLSYQTKFLEFFLCLGLLPVHSIYHHIIYSFDNVI